MPRWIDSHNHLQDPRLAHLPDLVDRMRAAGVVRCIANSTREADWDSVGKLAAENPDLVLPAYGIHPWQARTACEGWQMRLRGLLEIFPAASIGECGLDGWVGEPSIAEQMPVFVEQLKIARELDRTLTIHCLKAWDPLFRAFAAFPPPLRFLMHSFGGSLEIARRLLPMGAYFSFSGYFLHERKHATREVFKALPPDRILLETDAPDMSPPVELVTRDLTGSVNHPANLEAIGNALADILSITPGELAALTRHNAGMCFGF